MLEFHHKDSFASFHYKHAENPHLARWNENADIPRDDRDRGGYNIDTIRMQNQHTATGALLCPDTNTDAGLHYRATEYKMVAIHTELDVVIEYCTTPPLVKLFIALKKEEYARIKNIPPLNYNFISVWRRGFLCKQTQFKLLVKRHTDIIFPPEECKIIDDEEDPCCVIF
ncbi:hypothetical protein T492DRAFT_846432 [Pavlovales sp. CCMP2436]|nr:hypothetical protein T492DRAFT_846432 [Pavlovales sp. CCMP2436]